MAHIEEPASTHERSRTGGWSHFSHDEDIGIRGIVGRQVDGLWCAQCVVDV